MFGLDHTSGIEISENSPKLSTEDPERSAMGQGTHSYTNVQMARYVTALANRGNVYEISLIDKIVSSDGTVVKDNTPETVTLSAAPSGTTVIEPGIMMIKVARDTRAAAMGLSYPLFLDRQ